TPGAGPDLVGPASEEQGLGPLLPLPDQVAQLLAAVFGVVVGRPAAVGEAAVRVLLGTAASLDDAVEGDERLDHDGAHRRPPVCGGRWGPAVRTRRGRLTDGPARTADVIGWRGFAVCVVTARQPVRTRGVGARRTTQGPLRPCGPSADGGSALRDGPVPDEPGGLDAVHPHVLAPGRRVGAVVRGPVRDGLLPGRVLRGEPHGVAVAEDAQPLAVDLRGA